MQRGRSGRAKADRQPWAEDALIWGVPRRAGYDDHDDPKAHAGLVQHAFEVGSDERAICGFVPPKRASGPTAKPRPQLALPSTKLNPRCPKCVRLIAQNAPPEQLAPEPANEAAETATHELAGEHPADAAPEAPSDETAESPADEPPRAGQPPPNDGGTRGPTRQASRRPTGGNRPPPPPPPPPPPNEGPPAGRLPRAESWEGTAHIEIGEISTVVRPPDKPGLGVVASVVSGPSGTRVASVTVSEDGSAIISLSDRARGRVTVAWFVVPAVDGNGPRQSG